MDECCDSEANIFSPDMQRIPVVSAKTTGIRAQNEYIVENWIRCAVPSKPLAFSR